MKLNIKAANGGNLYNYTISRETYLKLAGQVFDLSAAKSKPENAKSGSLVSQTLHAYGCTGEKEVAFGEAVFPKTGEEFTDEHAEKWLEAMEMKQKRETKPLEVRQAEWDAKAATLVAAGLNPADFLSPKVRPVK